MWKAQSSQKHPHEILDFGASPFQDTLKGHVKCPAVSKKGLVPNLYLS